MHVCVCMHGCGELPQILCLTTGEEKGPFNVSIEATPFSVFIKWMELPENIPFVTGYNISVENLVTMATRTVYFKGNSTEANVTGLTPFTKYSFTVTAKYEFVFGPLSKAVVWRTREHGK